MGEIMRKSIGVAAVFALAAVAAGCASLNPFGSSKPKAAPATAAAGAQPAEPPKSRRVVEAQPLVRFDANTDGMVARAELEQMLTADFKKEDANSDEVLDVGETRALNERLRGEPGLSPVFDWNADGRLVFAEFATQWRTLFQRADVDGDGTVDEEELSGKRRERKPRPLPEPTFSGKDGRPPGSE